MQLREYERRALAELKVRFRKFRRVLAVAPTGAGKTVIGAAHILAHPRARVLWLAHREVLLDQAIAQLKRTGIPAADLGLLCGTRKENIGARVLVASVGMFRKRDVSDRTLVVIDEAHHAAAAGYQAITNSLPAARVLGLTATPRRLDGQPLGEHFDDLFVMVEAEELILDGYLARSRVFGVPKEKAKALVKGLASSGGDWSGRAVERAMRKRQLTEDIVKEWVRLANGIPTIVYASGVAHADDLLKRFTNARVKAAVLTWETPTAERDSILVDFRAGLLTVIINVAILAEGFDCPDAKCIVLARPTKSLTLYRQMCGRGARPTKSQRYLVLDETGNAWRHGFPESPVEWSLTEPLRGAGVAPVKRCPECGYIMPASTTVCPECGANQATSEEGAAQQAARLEEMEWNAKEKARRETVIREIAKARGWSTKEVATAIAVLV